MQLSSDSRLSISSIKRSSTQIAAQSDTSAVSTITSSQGGVLLSGQNNVLLQGVEVAAAKDVSITGGNVVIQGATDTQTVTGSTGTRSPWYDFGQIAVLTDVGEGFKARESTQTQVSDSTLVRSSITGANVSITAADTLALAGTTLNSPGAVRLQADTLVMGTQGTEHSTQTTSQGRDLVYQVSRDGGQSDQRTHYNQINAGSLSINANRVEAGLGARDSLTQLAQQPGMGWVDQLNKDPALQGRVNWQRVEEVHRQWDNDRQGLTPEGAAILTLVTVYFVGPLAQGAGAAAGEAVAVGVGEGVSLAGGGAFLTSTGAGISAVAGGAVAAGISALASQAAVAAVNNQFDLGATLDQLGSSDSIKNLLSAIVTGGVLGGLNLNPTGLPTVGGGAEPFMSQLGTNLQAGAARALINSAIHGTSLEDSLKDGLKAALLDTMAAQGAFAIGSNFEPGSAINLLAHALAGCAVGAARAEGDGGCAAGALGASLGELAGQLFDPDATGQNGATEQFASMIGGLGAALAGMDAGQINLAAQAGANAAANNWLATQQRAQMRREMEAANSALEKLKIMGKWVAVSGMQDALTTSGVGKGLLEAGISDVQGLAQFLANPLEGLNGLMRIIGSPEVRQQLGDAAFGELDAKLERMRTALELGGSQNAEQLGKDLGSLIWQLGSVASGVGATAKGGVALASAAASLGTRTLETAALQFMKFEAGAIKGFKSADEINAMMSATADWSPAWKPGTTVAEATMNPGTKVRMVVDKTSFDALSTPGANTSRAFGGWATFDEVPNAAYARNQLAITTDMKPSSMQLYVIEVQVTKPINAQVGVVGAQGAAAGGGNQLHFFLPPADRSSVFSYVAGSGRAL
ncbi:DUF637 domain-containing protein [Xenophilus arseniciresistens]|uniref:DUF637 domain-containing protein n=1 Tax=Xenophilus arseniciresistens TaxID=1283306 RepID=A0AAE3NEM7_9BURK|nr:DUF637 domain-containing protein [Xenophilus arseniciresistens]MDA7418214.1 DUF637 domain-containing protein [Xenophilus arseniciresistens]